MLFQTLDDKKECLGVYSSGVMYYDELPEDLTKTWSYSSHLEGQHVEYAQMYCGGLSLTEACPAELKGDLGAVTSKMRAYLRSFSEAKISLSEHCFFSLVPERFLVELCEVKNSICEHIFETHKRPDNYEFMLDVVQMVEDISYESLKLNKESARRHLGSAQGRALWNSIDSLSRHVKYNPYGTRTGRLSTLKGSFPILTLNKDFRDVLVPTNDWFVELDFNAAELRTLLGLTGSNQPQEDIHMWNVKNVYRGMVSREEAKQRIFAWLYNPDSTDHLSSRAYRRSEVMENHWDGRAVKTPFGRTIGADRKHALNYLVQSTSSDVFLDRAVEIHKFLKNKKSHVSMLIHDSVVLDLAEADMQELKKIVDIFSDTRYGKYKVGVSAGKSFGNMRRVR